MKKLFTFENMPVEVVVEGRRILFNTEDVAKAVGYASVKSLDSHIKGTRYDVMGKNGKRYMDRTGISFLVGVATKTKGVPRFAGWALKFKKTDIVGPAVQEPVKTVKPATTAVDTRFDLSGLKHSAQKLGMTAKELGDWLVAQGYAGRYTSNNALYWKQWFRDQKYGARPTIKDFHGERESNIAKLTHTGFEFVKNRLNSERQTNVLSFAKKEASEAEKLEAVVDQLIINEFKDVAGINSELNLIYTVNMGDLLKKVKGIIAQVKLKEKKT